MKKNIGQKAHIFTKGLKELAIQAYIEAKEWTHYDTKRRNRIKVVTYTYKDNIFEYTVFRETGMVCFIDIQATSDTIKQEFERELKIKMNRGNKQWTLSKNTKSLWTTISSNYTAS